MKKFTWIIALLTVFALIFTGCPGGGENTNDPDIPGPGGEVFGEGILGSYFPDTQASQKDDSGSTTTIITGSGASAVFTAQGQNLWAPLVNSAGFDADRFLGIRFEYKSNTSATIFFEDKDEIFLFTDGAAGADGWGWVYLSDDWASLELLFTNYICPDGGWLNNNPNGGPALYDFRKLHFQLLGDTPINKKFEIRNFTFIPNPAYTAPVLQSIAITADDVQSLYQMDEAFNPDGLVVKAVYKRYNNATFEKVITDYTMSAEGIENLEKGNKAITAAEGEKTITVKSGAMTANFKINVVSEFGNLTSIEVTPPARTHYKLNEAVNLAGFAVKGTYESGERPVTGGYKYTTSSGDWNGTAIITNTYGAAIVITVSMINNPEIKDTFTITVENEPLNVSSVFVNNVTAVISDPINITMTDGKLRIGEADASLIGEANQFAAAIMFNAPLNITELPEIVMKWNQTTGVFLVIALLKADGTEISRKSEGIWNSPGDTATSFIFTETVDIDAVSGVYIRIGSNSSPAKADYFDIASIEFRALIPPGDNTVIFDAVSGFASGASANASAFVTVSADKITVAWNPADENGAFRAGISITGAASVDLTDCSKFIMDWYLEGVDWAGGSYNISLFFSGNRMLSAWVGSGTAEFNFVSDNPGWASGWGDAAVGIITGLEIYSSDSGFAGKNLIITGLRFE